MAPPISTQLDPLPRHGPYRTMPPASWTYPPERGTIHRMGFTTRRWTWAGALGAIVIGVCCGDPADPEGTGSASNGANGSNGAATSGSGGSTAGTSCAQLWDCYGGCQDASCGQACYDAASPEAQTQDDALYLCLVNNGCNDYPCAEMFCASELAGCFGSGTGSSGSGSTGSGMGAIVCYAQGAVRTCNEVDGSCGEHNNNCMTQTVYGGGYGATQSEAQQSALEACTSNVTQAYIIGNYPGSCSVSSESCVITGCDSSGG